MKKIEKYLDKTSEHLFQHEGSMYNWYNSISTNFKYLKIIKVKDGEYHKLLINKDFEILKTSIINLKSFDIVSPNGKEYMPKWAKNMIFGNIKKTSIKHFKKVNEVIKSYIVTIV